MENAIFVWGSFFFLLGLIFGSFFNVVVYRLGSGMTLGGRSVCLSCAHELSALDLVPVVSYLFLIGRCRFCGSRISLQYPVVEALTGTLFLAVYLLGMPPSQTILSLAILSLALLIVVYDFRHMLIPDILSYGMIFLGLLSTCLVFQPLSLVVPSWSALLAGPFLALPLFLLWFFSRGAWLGLGDVKLELGIGFLLGFAQGLAALVLAFWMGAAVGLLLLLISFLRQRLFSEGKHFTMKSEVPFAPFLIAGLLVVFFFGIDFSDILALLAHVSY